MQESRIRQIVMSTAWTDVECIPSHIMQHMAISNCVLCTKQEYLLDVHVNFVHGAAVRRNTPVLHVPEELQDTLVPLFSFKLLSFKATGL